MTATATAERAPSRLLNRELSWLEYDGRVLELAEDPACRCSSGCGCASSSRRTSTSSSWCASRACRAGRRRASPSARPTAARRTRRSRRSARRVLELIGAPGAAVETRAAPGARRGGDRRRRDRRARRGGAVELERLFDDRGLPRADAARPSAPAQPFPYISGLSLSLGVFVRDPDTGDERFARVKVPELLPRFLRVGTARLPRPARAGDPALPAAAVHADGDRRVRDLPRHARRRPRGRRRRGRPARGRRATSCAAGGSASRSGSRPSRAISSRMLTVLKHGLDLPDEEMYLVEGLMDLADLGELEALPTARPEGRALAGQRARAPRRGA